LTIVVGGTDFELYVTVTGRSALFWNWLQTCRLSERLRDGPVNQSKHSSYQPVSSSLTRKDFPSCPVPIRMWSAHFSRLVGRKC